MMCAAVNQVRLFIRKTFDEYVKIVCFRTLQRPRIVKEFILTNILIALFTRLNNVLTCFIDLAKPELLFGIAISVI